MTEPTPEWTPPTTEERAATITRNYRDNGGRTPEAIEADDHVISVFTNRLRWSLADLDAATIGKVCIHVGSELDTVTTAVALVVTALLPGPAGAATGIAAAAVLTVVFGLLYARLWGDDDA